MSTPQYALDSGYNEGTIKRIQIEGGSLGGLLLRLYSQGSGATKDIKYSNSPIHTAVLDLMNLRQEEDEEDYIIKPSDHAFKTSLETISGAYMRLGAQFPRPSVAPTGDGGVRFEWRANNRYLVMACPSQEGQESYIYHEREGEYASVPQVSSESLTEWLRWLLDYEHRAE